MRYITNADGYIVTVSFGADVECEHGVCTEYEGGVPNGYTSLDAWYVSESEKLHRWKVVEGNLAKDEAAPKPPQCDSWVDRIYPVGSIYMSVSPTDPADLFGGTWQRIQDTFLLAAGDTYAAGAKGGEAEHELTVEELPEHTHELDDGEILGLRGIKDQVERFHVAAGSSYYAFAAPDIDGMVYHGNVASTGSGKAHNNMPPFLAVYMWQRVADPTPGDPDIPDEPDSGLAITDDGAGNVTIAAYGSASITYDGEGNVTIADSGSTSITDDGAGNVTIW